ncbi:AAA family ATPase [Peterkaempfera sp. SMS 1(5)a]|uniref:AAA family ATPase n=1 Tax=Peterkaempfera podocarpi TaxID=3232308 RepID=UPI00366E57D0
MPQASDPLPVLWLCGPAGVGKTTAGWEFFSRLTASGFPVGYVDIDQLGVFLPGPPEDPDRHRMKTQNLAAVLANFRERGARCVVVSGVVDPVQGVYVHELPGTDVTVCRLRADREELARRFTGRGMPPHMVQETLDEADVLDASGVGDVCIDTTGLAVSEVLQQMAERIGDWPVPGRSAGDGETAQAAAGRSTGREDIPARAEPGAEAWSARPLLPRRPSPGGAASRPPESGASAPGLPVLWLCGPTGVGKSTIGWQVYQRVDNSVRAAYLDLDQLAFLRPAPPDDPAHHRLKASNLAALWHAYRAAGARALIVTGQVDDEATALLYTAALPLVSVTLCRLRASRTTLLERINSRGQGGSWAAPGDPLKGRPVADLLRTAEEAAATAEALDRAALGHLCIATDDRTAEESAAAITAAWPSHRSSEGT